MAQKCSNPLSVPDLSVEASFGSSALRRKRTGMRQRRQHVTSGLHHLQPTRETILDLNSKALDPDHLGESVRFLLQKELKNSDVGSLGRIVLPKREAEAHLPVLNVRESFSLPMFDMETSQLWTFKYRYWPNNKSRMYILESTGDFVKTHNLQVGDFIMLYKDDEGDRYIIRARKARAQEPAMAPPIEDEIFDSIVPDIVVTSARYSDLFLPWTDGMNMAFGLNYAFSEDFPLSFPDEMFGNSSTASAESTTKLGFIQNLSLDDLP
ncbi:uncharacterized protein A4U43_C08F5170 [Asparagus officinalis]|uniref:B3 domain-containing protein LFL1-like n=1 Tax=Asparagus officinalis TaxID=4686 RepID=UPI00098E6A27|nr:B3 domain-containing protein LFL1-like [Asparagus officinalis]ONK59314.1 uncharacterized protein A4U43_C08F5170 [Asparagus officinalis]